MRRARPGPRVRAAVTGAAIVAITLGLLAWAGLAAGVAAGGRAEALDSFFPRGRVDPRIEAVGLDRRFTRRAALNPLGAYASLISRLTDAHAQTVIVALDALDTARAQFLGTTGLPATFEELLAAVIRPVGNVVLPIPEANLSPPRPGSRIRVLDQAAPSPVLADAAAATGVSAVSDPSQRVTRTVPLVVELRPPSAADQAKRATRRAVGSLVPSVALIAAIRAQHLRPTVTEHSSSVAVGDRVVPTEGDQELRVDYAAGLTGRSAHIIRASDLVGGFVPPTQLRDKTVFVGMTDPAFAKLLSTPVGRLPSVLVQANASNTLLTRQYLTPASDTTTILWVFGLGFFVAFFVLLLPMWLALVPPFVAAGGYWLYAEARFDAGHPTDVVYPLAAVVVAFVAAGGWKGITELLRRRRTAALFARYVPHTVARELLEAGRAEQAAAGQRLDVSVLFCDLRGFTALSAELEPTQVRLLLDTYYERVSTLVLERLGTVMKFVGDEVFAVFGAPLPVPDAAAVALDCARAVIAAGPALNDELAKLDLPAISYGIGLHYGEVVAAHVGSTTRRQYDVVGDTVNVGSRLCGQAASGEIVFSDELRRRAGDSGDAENLGTLTLKGVSRTITGYRIPALVVDAHSSVNPSDDISSTRSAG